MDLNVFAVLFMGGYVVAVVAAGLVLALRPGGGSVRLSTATRPATSDGPRDEIVLGTEAEALGVPRGAVEAVHVRPDNLQIVALALASGNGLLDSITIPASALVSADGHTVHLAERWDDSQDRLSETNIRLRRGMPVRSIDRRRRGRLHAVCLDRGSLAVTALATAARGAKVSRLIPIERVREVGGGGIITDVTAGEWASLPVFRTDRDLEEAVMDQLAADPALAPFRRSLTVDVHDQVVYLRGHVVDRDQAYSAAALARSTPGALRVVQGIVNDADLVEAVQRALSADPGTSSARVQVRSRLGQVQITGEADPATARNLQAVARRVPGVEAVYNYAAPEPASA
jgi:osmotically-inducible protein OsmY